MESFVDSVVQNLLEKRTDLFGERSTFVAWESETANFAWPDGYQSTANFGRIGYRTYDGQRLHSDQLVLKCAQHKSWFVDFHAMSFTNEAYFYTRIWPAFRSLRTGKEMESEAESAAAAAASPSLFAECYGSRLEFGVDEFAAVIVLQNLQAQGFTSSKKRSFVDYSHLSLMMRKLGEFHAYSYKARQSTPFFFETLAVAARHPQALLGHFFRNKLRTLGVRGVRLLKRDPKYADRMATIDKLLRDQSDFLMRLYESDGGGGDSVLNDDKTVLCHGDYLRSNVLFRYDQEGQPVDMRMVDMANVRLGSPVHDLMMPLYMHADQRTRDAHWYQLIDEYYDSLSGTFADVRVPAKEDIVADLKIKCFDVYLTASHFLGQVIALDNNLPDKFALAPEQYRNCTAENIPEEVVTDVVDKLGGALADQALVDILKDMIDRGFL